MGSFTHLNDKQRQAVLHRDGPLLILAGAGSGKTTVLIERVAYLIEQGVSPWAILAITFTNKAAGELRERLEAKLGGAALNVWAATFHATCVRILRRHIERLGFSRYFTIYDADDSQRVIKELVKSLGWNSKEFPPRMVCGEISRAKDQFMAPSALLAHYQAENNYLYTRIAELYGLYQQKLKEANALDFDDLLWHTVVLFQEHPDVLAAYQDKFQYLLVDEYQDTNHLQYLLTTQLAAKWRNICVVGDDDQSIYRFRGATIENILNFEKQYPNAQVIRLEQNYRSTQTILEAANGVIANNRGRKSKTLWTDNAKGEPVLFVEAEDDREEAAFVARTILEGKGKGTSFRDYCVLYRMNAQSNRMEDSFRRHGIPYRIIGGVRFFDRMEVKDMLAYLCVVHNPADNVRLLRIVNTPARGIGDKTMETVAYLASRDNLPLYQVMARADTYPELSRPARLLREFVNLIDYLRVILPDMTLAEFYNKLIEKTGYVTALLMSKDEDALIREQNVKELGSSLVKYAEDNEEPSLGGFLDEVALFTDIERYDEGAEAVVMMTMHSAKGLEFPHVFVVGAEENIFPGVRTLFDEQEIEEERRLCYVALTRARQRLYISCAQERTLFGQTAHNPVSRFVEEIPAHCKEAVAQKPVQPMRRSVLPPPRRGFAAVPPRAVQNTASPASFMVGQRVRHKAFGEGQILTLTPMGGDALIEIAFDASGTKRLMLKQASAYMEKIE